MKTVVKIDTSIFKSWKCLRAYYLAVEGMVFPTGVAAPEIPEEYRSGKDKVEKRFKAPGA